jgi:predicted NACHT family NTPase
VVTECNAGKLQAHRIPVLIRLRDFVKDGREVLYALKPYLEKRWQLSDAESLLNQGRVLVLLDGLDEVTGEDGNNIAEAIKWFAGHYLQVQVIVTCRTQSFTGKMNWKSLNFQFVEVADFKEPQVRLFAKHWFNAVETDQSAGPTKAEEFLELLFREENKPIRELAITPILLSLTCAVFHQTGKFYSKRSKLYEEGLELLLEQWDKSREIERDEIYRDLSVERKLELLSYLAVKKFEQTQYVLFEQTEIERYIAEFLGIGQRDSRAVLRAMESQHGLLIERAQKVWSFSHLTFQEYLVTRQILANCNPLSINDPILNKLVSHVIDKRWREVFLLATTMLEKPDVLFSLMKAIIDKLLLKYPPLQNFLIWVNQKSKSVDTPYKSAAVRVFYFNNCGLGFFPKIENSIYFDIEETPFQELQGELSIDYHLKRALEKSYNLARDIQQGPEGDPDAKRGLYDISYDLVRGLVSGLRAYPQSGENMIEELSQVCKYDRYQQWKEFKQWWQTNGKGWTKKLKLFMTEYRNIEHDWQFSEEQNKLLQQYNDANELLVDCLNSGCSISQKVKQEIEEMLLLPIAEIEKRKREKTD